MSRHVEWIEPGQLGQLDPISFEQMLHEPTPPTETPPEKTDDLEKRVEEEEKEIQQIERGLSTTEKVVIASLFLQVLAFAWGIYSFNVRQNRREPT